MSSNSLKPFIKFMAIVLGGLFLIMLFMSLTVNRKELVRHRDVRTNRFMVAIIAISIGLMMKIMKPKQTVRRMRLLF